VFKDSFSETDGLLGSYEDIVKEIADVEKALSDGWTETEAAIYGSEEAAKGYL
jgi:hypothetical protein